MTQVRGSTLEQLSQTVMGRRLASRALALLVGEQQGVPLVGADEQPPAAARAAAHRALDEEQTHYTSGPGMLPLRQALAERSTADGFPTPAETVVVTNGGAEALYIALQCVLQRGQRMLLGGPVLPQVREMLAFIGVTAVSAERDAAARFSVQVEDVASIEADALLLASPSPVTGQALDGERLAELVSVASARGMTVIVDRSLAWCGFDPDTARFPDAALGEMVLTTGSFSHAYAMSGWRAGYITAPQRHFAVMRELKVAMSICTSSITQCAALAALQAGDTWLAERRATFAARRGQLLTALRGTGFVALESDAWPYLLLQREDGADASGEATRLSQNLGVRVSDAGQCDPALRGYLRADLSAVTAGKGGVA
jgi:aspartate/methionine/tyrosine aminotransferase